jgi:dockerin type I repeat protein
LVKHENLILKYFVSPDGPHGPAPDEKIDENINVDPVDFDPPAGSPPMIADPFAPCDLDGDGDCDTVDLQLVTNAIGECDNGDNYNELADADHDGCVTDTDREILLSSDFDGDELLDFDDTCPNSDLQPTVVINGCDSEVPNTFSNGCTISDKVAECANGATNHGQFVSCVSHLTNDLKKAGTITGQQKGAIQNCAAQANIPSPSVP